MSRSEKHWTGFDGDAGSYEFWLTADDARGASHPGACDDDVAALLREPYVAAQLEGIGAAGIRDALKPVGAWEDDELSDDDANRARFVWIAAGQIADELSE